MFGSNVMEVALGLIFCYAALALIVSSLQEAIASALRLRARGLLDGIKSMLNDPAFNGLARQLYTHALVNPHYNGQASDQRMHRNTPSYIAAHDFATALLDSVSALPNDMAALGRDIDAMPNAQVRQVLQALYRRAEGDLPRFQTLVGGWFDSAMEHVSGAYKRRAQVSTVLLTFAVAALFNIDSIHLFSTLWQHPLLATQLADSAHLLAGTLPTMTGSDALDIVCTLPIGWCGMPGTAGSHLGWQLAGWIITASSGLFGAPVWFDLLQRVVSLRGTGQKPQGR